VVSTGESFWSIAESHVIATDPLADDASVTRYWKVLINTNRHVMPVHDNPDLLFPGTVLRLPPYSG
jgi:nucleoid-associated protein YgaU